MSETTDAAPTYPPGDYAIVELFGHTTIVGRIAEVEHFGTKMLAIEPLFNGQLLPAVLQGGTSIYRLTPCTPETAFRNQPKHHWQLPSPIAVTLPPALIAADPVHSSPVEGSLDEDES